MRIVVYAPPGRRARHHQQNCVAWCERQGYRVAGITSDPAAAAEMVSRDAADIAVVARDVHGRQLPDVPVMRIPRGRGLGVLLPALAAPLGWLAGRARHPAVAAGLAAGTAAGVLTLTLAPEPDRPFEPRPPAIAPSLPPGQPADVPGRPSPRPSRAATPPAGSRPATPGPAESPVAPTGPTQVHPSSPGGLLPPAPQLPAPTPSPPGLPPLPDEVCTEVEAVGVDLEVCLDPPGVVTPRPSG